MNRQLTALFCALEAVLVVAVGVAIPLFPATLLWGIHFGLEIEWIVFWRAAVDTWLLGHGVDVTVTLDAATVTQLGFPAAGVPFTLTIALLGFSLLSVLLGVRAGRRIAQTRHRALGALVSLGTFGLVSLLLTLSALHPVARPSLVQGTLLPSLVFALGLAIGMYRAGVRPQWPAHRIRHWVMTWPSTVRSMLMVALRGGVAAAAAVMLCAAVLCAGAIAFSYASVITLYESLHTEVLGGVTITLGQLALLPNLVVYTASWLVGPGFALGTGSSVSPLATQLGPIPAIPVLGALPTGQLVFGFVGLLVPLVTGFVVGAVLASSARRGRERVMAALGVGLVGGVILGMLAWASAGAVGPGRLQDVGPNPLAVGAWAALELAVAALAGLSASLRRRPAEEQRAQR
ncbi:MAG: cell division protein PerM [Rhodoglobus sp.]